MAQPVRVAVEDASQVAGARELATRSAREAGFSQTECNDVALAATELAENLHRHAVGGEFAVVEASDHDLALLAVDRGPGVDGFERCLVDGYSTTGTMGTGLGAVRRLARSFDAASEPGLGTVVLAEFRARAEGARGRADAFDVGAVGFPVWSETVNGDAWALARHGTRLVVALADGLGHGPDAAAAGRAAVADLDTLDGAPAVMIEAINGRTAGTRGAAVTVVTVEVEVARRGGRLTSCGVGNVSLLVAGRDGATRRIATTHGTAGARLAIRAVEQHTAFPAGGVLVLHTDGLTARWTLEGRAELLRHRALVVAAALLRDHARGADDTYIVVVKAAEAAA